MMNLPLLMLVLFSDLSIPATFFSRLKGKSQGHGAKQEEVQTVEPEVLMTKDLDCSDSWDHAERERDVRQGIDLATTLERIEKNFVITDPRLPDNPIVSYLHVLSPCSLFLPRCI